MKSTSYRKAECRHMSDADKSACPLCNPTPKARKVRRSKFMFLYGKCVATPQTFAEAAKLVAKHGRKRPTNTSGFLKAVK